MAGKRKSPWLDPNKEGRAKEAGETVLCLLRKYRAAGPILRRITYGLERDDPEKERTGLSCCGRLPPEVKVGKGYRNSCWLVVGDPASVPKFGLCRVCAENTGSSAGGVEGSYGPSPKEPGFRPLCPAEAGGQALKRCIGVNDEKGSNRARKTRPVVQLIGGGAPRVNR